MPVVGRRRRIHRELAAPRVQLPRRDLVPPRHISGASPWRECLGQDLQPLLVVLRPAALRPRKYRDLAHPPLLCAVIRALLRAVLHMADKAAFGGWILLTLVNDFLSGALGPDA